MSGFFDGLVGIGRGVDVSLHASHRVLLLVSALKYLFSGFGLWFGFGFVDQFVFEERFVIVIWLARWDGRVSAGTEL